MSERIPVTLHDPGNPIGCEFVRDFVETDYRVVLIVRFAGRYRAGSSGTPGASYMRAMVRAGETRWAPAAVVLDLTELAYEWGDDLEAVFGPDCPHAPGVRAVVVGPACREAVGTLLFGENSTRPATDKEGFFEDVDAAVAYVRGRLGKPDVEVVPWPQAKPLTEAEWLASRDPAAMWEWLVYGVPGRRKWFRERERSGRAGDRELVLYSAACCRRVWHLMDERSRRAVDVAERSADGEASAEEAADAQAGANAAYRDALEPYNRLPRGKQEGTPEGAAMGAATVAAWVHEPLHGSYVSNDAAVTAGGGDDAAFAAESAAQADLLRDIFGNPFKPFPDATRWRTESVLRLAREIYARRRFDRMPELGAALEAAGCDDPAVLGHCRGGGVHVRGCWVVDVVLGVR